MSKGTLNIADLQARLRHFAAERDWEQFHSPKNLAMALSVEVAELVEVFQWLSQAQSKNLDESARAAASEEIADVQIYLLQLADALKIDLSQAIEDKLLVNAQKYQVDRVRGSAEKSQLKES